MTWDTSPRDGEHKLSDLKPEIEERNRIRRAATVKDLVFMAKLASPHLVEACRESPQLAREALAMLDTIKSAPGLTVVAEATADLCKQRIEDAIGSTPSRHPAARATLTAEAEAKVRAEIEYNARELLAQERQGYPWMTREQLQRVERKIYSAVVEPLVRQKLIGGATISVGYDSNHRLALGTVRIVP